MKKANAKRITKVKKVTKTKPNDLPAAAATTAAAVAGGPDPFDVDKLRLDPSFEATAGVRKVLSTVPVRKPHPQEWIRVHSDPLFRGNFSVIKLKQENEFYLLTPAVAADFEVETTQMTIYTAINTLGVVMLWPCTIASPDGRQNAWHLSAHEAAAEAMKRRIKIRANMALGAYDGDLDSPTAAVEPVWPIESFNELVRLAFAKVGRY